jgi:SPP1 gp7 family putative phage head morphogenesis protein
MGNSEPKQVAVVENKRTPIEFFPTTPVAFLDVKAPQYSELAKDLHWKAVINTWEALERGYEEDLKAWIFAQRSYVLQLITRGDGITHEIEQETLEDAYWQAQAAKLVELTRPWFMRALEATEDHVRALLDLRRRSAKQRARIQIDDSWSIFDTDAIRMLEERLEKITAITDTVRKSVRKALQDAITEGLTEQEAAEAVRDKFNVAQNRAKTIARTEIGGALQDSRIAAYEQLDFEKHEWLTARDAKVRDEHRIDGEVQKIGDDFSNGMRWPYDNEVSDPGLIINCRCLTVPITEDDE